MDPFAPLSTGDAPPAASFSSPQQKTIVMPAPVEPPDLSSITHRGYGTATARWVYRNREGQPLLATARFDKRTADGRRTKDVLPMVFIDERQAWTFGTPESGRPIYGLDRLAEEPDSPVLLCEGEKAADAGQQIFLDHVSVAAQGGCKAAGKTDWLPLRDRDVVIWPDQDAPGRDFARDALQQIKAAGARSARIVSVPEEWPEHWDVADPLPPGVTTEMLLAMAAVPRAKQLTVLTPSQCEIGTHRAYVIKGLLSRGDHGEFIGQPGSGKSVAAPFVGYCIARGISLFGLRVRQGKVLYFAPEDGHGMKLRVRALRKRFGDTDDFFLIPDDINLMDPEAGDFDRVCKLIEQHKPAVVFIDTLQKAFPGLRENESDSMGHVVAVARNLSKRPGNPAIITVHHVTKDGGLTPRGHGSLNGDLDVTCIVAGEKADPRTIKLGKNRNGPSDLSFAFNVAIEDFGLDEDGDLITAPVADPVTLSTGGDKTAREAKLRDAPALMLREIRNLVTQFGELITPEPGFPAVLSITRHQLRKRLIDRGWFADGLLSADQQGKLTLKREGYGPESASLKALERRGIIAKTQIHVWLL